MNEHFCVCGEKLRKLYYIQDYTTKKTNFFICPKDNIIYNIVVEEKVAKYEPLKEFKSEEVKE